MRSIQTTLTFPLSSIKPLEGLLRYRRYCLDAMRDAFQHGVMRRDRSPVSGVPLEPVGTIEGFSYGRCPDGGGLFLMTVTDPQAWTGLLADVSRYRHSPDAFHADLAHSRSDHVYAPKLEWIRDTLRFQEFHRPTLLEVTTPPSDFTPLLEASGLCAAILTREEMGLVRDAMSPAEPVQVAVLLESLDRVDDPVALLHAVHQRLVPGGLLFVTALVASGFDMAVLGLRNLYLYPPDRTNCFTLQGLQSVLERAGFGLLEVSTPGVLDLEIVQAHRRQDPALALSAFEEQLLAVDQETREAFQAFLQQQRLSSFARLVARKLP